MKPYLLKARLQHKDPEIRFDTCQVDHVVELSESAFREFQKNLLAARDFLREYNWEYTGDPAGSVRPGLMVLANGYEDGIFVCTEGSDYARYSAYVPNARQILLFKTYPELHNFCKGMSDITEKYIQKAITVGLPEPFRISLAELRNKASYFPFSEELFAEMLSDRPEVSEFAWNQDEIQITLSSDFLAQQGTEMKTVSDEEFKVTCAKHLLWIYGAGGKQADFSNCVFDHVSFSGMELNGAAFDGARFLNCNLSNAMLCFATLNGCTFIDCDCQDWNAEAASFQQSVFDHCNLNGAVMTHSNFTNAVLQDCEMGHASLQNCLIANMRLEDVETKTLNMSGVTEEASLWHPESHSDNAMEELK